MSEKIQKGYGIPDYPSYRRESTAAYNLMAIAIVFSLLFSLGVFYWSNQRVSEAEAALRERDNYELVLDKETSTTYMARKEEITPEIRRGEFKQIARVYFTHMYGFNRWTYEDHMRIATRVSGEVGDLKYEEYQDNNMFSRLVNEQLSLIAKVDSIHVIKGDMSYLQGYLFGKQRFVKPLGSGMYEYIAEFRVEDIGERVTENLTGAALVEFDVILKERIQLKEDQEYE